MRTRIHVNQHNVRANTKGANLPVLTVKTYKDKPLSCGARVWIETEAEVEVPQQPVNTQI